MEWNWPLFQFIRNWTETFDKNDEFKMPSSVLKAILCFKICFKSFIFFVLHSFCLEQDSIFPTKNIQRNETSVRVNYFYFLVESWEIRSGSNLQNIGFSFFPWDLNEMLMVFIWVKKIRSALYRFVVKEER